MVDFETEGVIDVLISDSSLRQARRDIEEELGPKTFEVDVSGGSGGGSARRGRESIRLDRTRNDLLRAILDELDGGIAGNGDDGFRIRGRGGSGGGGGLGGVIGGVGALLGLGAGAIVGSAAGSGSPIDIPFLPPTTPGSPRGGGSSSPTPTPSPAPTNLPFRQPEGGPAPSPTPTPDPGGGGLPDIPLPTPEQALGGALVGAGALGIREVGKSLGSGAGTAGAGLPIVPREAIPDSDTTRSLRSLVGTQGDVSDSVATASGRQSLVRDYKALVGNSGRNAPLGGGTQSTVSGPGGSGRVDVTVNVPIDISADASANAQGSTRGIERQIDQKLDEAKRDIKRDIRRDMDRRIQ